MGSNKVYLITGEASGDFIGSQIINNLNKLSVGQHSSDIAFVGIGGSLMQKQGLNSLFSLEEISLMGFFEVVPHIFRLKKLINQTVQDIIFQSPDLLITIDSPGFTYRVAKKVRELKPDLKIIHIVAPSVWAYKPSRALKYAKVYDHLLALLPFEPPYFSKVGLHCSYIGHPVLEQQFCEHRAASSKKIICITAGSRYSEIIRHMPVFAKAIDIVHESFKNLQVIFVLANEEHKGLISSFLASSKFNFTFSTDRLKSFAMADAALAKSGTNTLEIAASSTPMVVAYKLNYLSFLVVRLLIKVKYASLINIIANRKIIPEFIQSNCRAEKIANAINSLLSTSEIAKTQVAESEAILKQLGFKADYSPSMVAAKIIRKLLK